jgi:hypothetical protein
LLPALGPDAEREDRRWGSASCCRQKKKQKQQQQQQQQQKPRRVADGDENLKADRSLASSFAER